MPTIVFALLLAVGLNWLTYQVGIIHMGLQCDADDLALNTTTRSPLSSKFLLFSLTISGLACAWTAWDAGVYMMSCWPLVVLPMHIWSRRKRTAPQVSAASGGENVGEIELVAASAR